MEVPRDDRRQNQQKGNDEMKKRVETLKKLLKLELVLLMPTLLGIALMQMWIASWWGCRWAQNLVCVAGLLASVGGTWWWSRSAADGLGGRMILGHPLRTVFAELVVVAVCIGAILAVKLDARARVKSFVPQMEANDVR